MWPRPVAPPASRPVQYAKYVKLGLAGTAPLREPPPEARLIRARREKMRLSVRGAAARAAISETLWRRVEKGHMLETGGEAVAVRGTAVKVAAMAAALGVTAAELEEAGRADAAAQLGKMAAPDGGFDPAAAMADLEVVRGLTAGQRRILRAVIAALAAEEPPPGESYRRVT